MEADTSAQLAEIRARMQTAADRSAYAFIRILYRYLSRLLLHSLKNLS
jgi:hypothetical protein